MVNRSNLFIIILVLLFFFLMLIVQIGANVPQNGLWEAIV